MFRSKAILGWLVISCALIASCASVNVDRAWQDPTAPPSAYHSVMVFCSCPDSIAARILEDDVAHDLGAKGVRAQPTYQVVGSEDLSKPQLRERFQTTGIDGIVLVKMTGIENKAAYVPGVRYTVPVTHYDQFYERFVTVYQRVHEPGYFDPYQVLDMQADVYDALTGKLVTSLSTSQVKSGDVSADMRDFAKTVVSELERMRVVA